MKVRIVDEKTLNRETTGSIGKRRLLYAQYQYNKYMKIFRKEGRSNVKERDGEVRLNIADCLMHTLGAIEEAIGEYDYGKNPLWEPWMEDVRKIRNQVVHEQVSFSIHWDTGIHKEFLIYKIRNQMMPEGFETREASLEIQPFLETALVKTEELTKKYSLRS